MSSGSPLPTDPAVLRKGYWSAHIFQFFNAISFTIFLGTPVIVYAKSLGASSTVLGVLAAFTPLLTIMQLPAAYFLPRFTYKQFVMGGWSLRIVFIVIAVVIPLLAFLDDTSKLVVVMACIFFFNLIRGISSAAFMPWITVIVPSGERGRFLSLDQSMTNLGALVALLLSAWIMTGPVENWEFAAIFLVSALAGMASLYFLKRIPDAGSGEEVLRSGQAVPWGVMFRYPPFFILMIFNVFFLLALGGLGVFTVEYLREIPGLTISSILWLSSLAFVAALVCLPIAGRVIDRVGSKPVLYLALIVFSLVVFGWLLLAAEIVPVTHGSVAVLTFLSGVAGANFHLANSRIAMAIMPEMGRNHFFALFAVVSGLGLGAAPVLWGVSLDAIGSYVLEGGWFILRRHGIYFLGVFIVSLGCLALIPRLHEPSDQASGGVEHPLYGKIKRLGRIWNR